MISYQSLILSTIVLNDGFRLFARIKSSHARMFSRPKVLFLVSLLFVALLTYLLNFFIYVYICMSGFTIIYG